MSILTKFFGRTASEGAAFALGLATGPVLAPEVEELKNETWRLHPSRTIDAALAAEIVAEDVEQIGWGANEAKAHGFNGDRFSAIVGAVLNAPGMSELLETRRRGLITDAEFLHGLRKAKLETLWDDALTALLDVLLSPAELANAVVQGHLTQAAASAEAEKQGMTPGRFSVLVENTGLPPGPETLLAWRRRNIIDDAELDQGIREGHTKVKYIPDFHQALRNVLAHTTYAGLRLRGWITADESYAGGALTGYSKEDMDLEYLNRGRPATVHQIHIGYARGATVPGARNEEDAIRQAVERSDIRPEYADVLYAQRYSLPSAFALRGLVQAGDLTEAEGRGVLIDAGWDPALAAKVAAAWAQPTSATAVVNPRIKRARDQVYNATHSSYLDNEVDRARAVATLERIGLTAAVAGQVVDLWEVENEVLIKPLTPANVKKAYKKADFTIDEAVARLVNVQWSAEDARTYLTT